MFFIVVLQVKIGSQSARALVFGARGAVRCDLILCFGNVRYWNSVVCALLSKTACPCSGNIKSSVLAQNNLCLAHIVGKQRKMILSHTKTECAIREMWTSGERYLVAGGSIERFHRSEKLVRNELASCAIIWSVQEEKIGYAIPPLFRTSSGTRSRQPTIGPYSRYMR